MAKKKETFSFGGAPVKLHSSNYPEISTREDGDNIIVDTNVRYLIDGQVYLYPLSISFPKDGTPIHEKVKAMIDLQVNNYTKPNGLQMRQMSPVFQNQIVLSKDQSTEGDIFGRIGLRETTQQ